MDKDLNLPDTNWRTSTQHFLQTGNDKTLLSIDKRVAKLTKSRTAWQEAVQVLRYFEGQKYDQHTDYFDARYYKNDPKTLKLIRNGEKNRLITVLWYMTNVTDGGETIFPLAYGGKSDTLEDGTTNCEDRPDALKVKPVQGDVIIFYSLYADGYIDKHSLHAACPVGPNQIKYAANKWIWNADV
jgi:prolyl 4-hydroxylase